jgi:hypothetical protein
MSALNYLKDLKKVFPSYMEKFDSTFSQNLEDVLQCLSVSDINRQPTILEHPLEVNIDFDEAIRANMINKKKLPNGMYQYVCGAKKTTTKGYCRKDGSNIQYIKKQMRTPGTISYVYGMKPQVIGLPWERCGVHRHIPLC